MKFRIVNICLSVFLIIALANCENDTDNVFDDLSVEKTIENVSYGNDSKQRYDLYLPANRNNSTKTLILIHGGGWNSGDKSDMSYIVPVIKQFLPKYAIVNMNYRLATNNQPAFPMQLDDIEQVILKLQNSNYSISNQYGLIGTSAGGHLSMLFSYTKNQTNSIKMVCNIVGPSNFTDSNYINNPSWVSLLYNVTGVNYNGQNASYFEQLSPYHKATATSVPTLAFYGNTDELIPLTQGTNLKDRLNNLGVYNEYYLYNGGHGTWSQSDYLDMFNKIKTFVENKF